jgi:phosphoenolpyruvate carboxykinase (GTP)
MAMQPFCGYNFGDYWSHWLSFGKKYSKLPKIFHVNWFRQDKSGQFMWPGFGDNMRVLEWILQRCTGSGEAVRTPIGYLPTADAINTVGTGLTTETMRELLSIEASAWKTEMAGIKEYFDKFGTHIPAELLSELKRITNELNS